MWRLMARILEAIVDPPNTIDDYTIAHPAEVNVALYMIPAVKRKSRTERKMMSTMSSTRLIDILRQNGAQFRTVSHTAEGRSDRVAELRGTTVHQGAKAIVCCVSGTGAANLVLAVVPGDKRVDMQKVAAAVGGVRANIAPKSLAEDVSGCEIGAIPPVVLDGRMILVADATLLATELELAFNAGCLDRSIVIDTADYVRIANPQIADIAST